MVTHMKTTVEISDALLEQAKALARREKVSLRTLIEDGLRTVLKTRRARSEFKLRDCSVDGNGLQSPYTEGEWDAIRKAAYEGRGG